MAIQNSILTEAADDLSAILGDVSRVISERGMNLADDFTSAEHIAKVVVDSAAKLGVPYAGTAEAALPLAHSLISVLAQWWQGKQSAPASVPMAPAQGGK